MLNFEFKKSNLQLTPDELEKAKEQSEKGFSKFLDQGTHEVKITEAEFSVNKDTGSCMCEKDPSWGKVRLTLSDASDRTTRITVLVPTSSLKYGTGKGAHFPFLKLAEFMAGIGETVEADAKVMTVLTKKYFSDLSKLVGKELKIDIGFKGPYIKYIDKGQFQICKADGSVLVDEIIESKEMAALKAADLKLNIQKYAEIIKIHGSTKVAAKAVTEEAPAPAAKADDDDWG